MTTIIDLDHHRHGAGPDVGSVDVSVVMPCLNEEESVGVCVRLALEGIAKAGLRGEVIVSDNGSTDESVAVATTAGARVVHQPSRGYGNAYLKGFAEARGDIIVMGDSDGTYDFSQLDQLVAPLVDGEADYVLGSRFGGEILKGAMPWSHRYIGNPVLTSILNRCFGLRSSDAHSGMRAFTREAYERMGLRCEGMEFASEIVIKAARSDLRVHEIPITYHPRTGESKLNSVRDGWRHLRFMLLLAPGHLFVLPGLVMFVLGLIGQTALLPRPLDVGSHALDMHFSALFALVSLVGSQLVVFGLFAKGHARSLHLELPDRFTTWFADRFTLERGLVIGAMFFVVGLLIDMLVLIEWLSRDLGPMNAIRPALYAMTLMMVGLQMTFASFFLSLSSGHAWDAA